jgi:hypothetical protein
MCFQLFLRRRAAVLAHEVELGQLDVVTEDLHAQRLMRSRPARSRPAAARARPGDALAQASEHVGPRVDQRPRQGANQRLEHLLQVVE